MTHQKSIPTDSHFRHNPSTDHPPHLHSQGDILPPSGGRARETIDDGRRTGRRQLMEDKVGKSNAGGTDGLAMTQNFTNLQIVEGLDRQDMIWETLKALLTPEELDRLCLSPSDLRYFWTASLDPPVTRESLSELDLERISSDSRLRHDVNFDREVSFRPNLQGAPGIQKLELARGYWDALVIEFQLYISRCRKIFSQTSGASMLADSPWLLGLATAGKVRLRLPRMFQVINEILKTLVPESEWDTVDARLDIKLLIQELENGACDIVALSEWLGDLLQGSCSPMRDSSVQATVLTIQRGVEREDARLIIAGLKSFFGILETMKLDVANHQIRTLRLLMVEDFVQFQQKAFLRKIPCEPNLKGAYSWFYTPNTVVEVQDKREYVPNMELFLRGVVDVVATNNPDIPPTFEYDYERLRILQIDFQTCLMKAACRQVFTDTLHILGRKKTSTPNHSNNLTNHISTLVTTPPTTHNPSIHMKPIALEIVREAHKACNIQTLPSDVLLAETERSLHETWTPNSPIFESLEGILGNELGDLVDEMVDSVADLTPLQLLDHLNPVPSKFELKDERSTLVDIARRIAHIAILHWRVWGPILYLQPRRDVLAIAQSSPSDGGCGYCNQISEDGPRKIT